MKYIDYKESIRHGAFDFPIAYYAVNAQHPRYHMMFHWHPEYEIVRIRRGKMRMNLDGLQFTAEAGDTVIVNDGVCHSGEPEDCEYECLVFDLHRFVKRLRRGGKHPQPQAGDLQPDAPGGGGSGYAAGWAVLCDAPAAAGI